MGRVEEAHRLLLLALSRNPQRSPILVRLALLQLRKGFMYDGNQVRRTWLAERMRKRSVMGMVKRVNNPFGWYRRCMVELKREYFTGIGLPEGVPRTPKVFQVSVSQHSALLVSCSSVLHDNCKAPGTSCPVRPPHHMAQSWNPPPHTTCDGFSSGAAPTPTCPSRHFSGMLVSWAEVFEKDRKC